MTETFDAIVIGMGPAGEAVAGDLAEAGLSVAGIDRKLVGGECPYWGCIPSKMMIRAGDLLAEARRVDGIAGTATVTPDWAPVARRIRDEATDDWDDRVAVERFEGKGGTFVRGAGRLVGPGTVAVGDRTFTARRAVVLATGTEPAIPPIPGLADVPYWTNRDVVEAKELPSSLLVLGGGAIGVELAQALSRFGVTVTVIEALDRLVPLETPAAGELIARVFIDEGIEVTTGVAVERVERDGARIAARLADGRTVAAAQLLVATGRRTNLPELGVATIGIDDTQRFAPVDSSLRAADGVWAVGDLTGKGAFTHVGMYQARIATADILGAPHEPADYHALPRVTFTDPEIGSVGLTPALAAEAGIDVRVGTTLVPHTARGWIHKAGNDGFIELVEDRARGVLVGATAAGPNGGEVLGLLTLAVHAEIPVERLRQMIYAYPTFHRGIEDALRDLVS
ncbi:MAG: NAD(P)/FAD-dependent oxidoreductase [Acidimicrobiia bacterium]|nr:NAD(P)/FAD-dependent oxidoreductase [Acidimicrobiia bacterium]